MESASEGVSLVVSDDVLDLVCVSQSVSQSGWVGISVFIRCINE